MIGLYKIDTTPTGEPFKSPVILVQDSKDTFNKFGHIRNYFFTVEEWIQRSNTYVSPSSHGADYDSKLDGVPFSYFVRGFEGSRSHLLCKIPRSRSFSPVTIDSLSQYSL